MIETSLALLSIEPAEVLLIGLGGGSMSTYINQHLEKAHIDVVERSKLVRDAAIQHFAVRESDRLHIHICDAFDFLKNMSASTDSRKTTYELVLVDVYSSGSCPDFLSSTEFCQLLKGGVDPRNGVVAINVCGSQVRKMQQHLAGVGFTVSVRTEAEEERPPGQYGSVNIDKPKDAVVVGSSCSSPAGVGAAVVGQEGRTSPAANTNTKRQKT
jgi:spermidine synthase